MTKKFILLILSLLLFCTPVFGGYVEDNTPSPANASIGGEWALIGMLGAGTASDSVKQAYLNNLKTSLAQVNGVLSERKYTEYSRVVIALNLLGEDAASFGGYNLVTPLTDKTAVQRQGINGTIFALIALNGGGYGTEAYKNELLSSILSEQGTDGIFNYGGAPNADITAMALCALSPYSDRPEVKSAIDKAVNGLSSMVDDSGLILTDGIYSSETISQAVIGLSAVGVDAEKDSRFVRGGVGLVSRLKGFAVNGGYAHLSGGEVNPMASEQGLCAEGAYKLYTEGKGALYYQNAPVSTYINTNYISAYFKSVQKLLEVLSL
jgi:hypothetical protein